MYNRNSAVEYARKWALGRNPKYANFDGMGGDCTNFASQCLYAGGCKMNNTPTFGWYYYSLNNRAPAWTGVQYLQNFLLRSAKDIGPHAKVVELNELDPGDLIQLGHNNNRFYHTLVVAKTNHNKNTNEIFVCSHTYNSIDRPLSSYIYDKAINLHII